MAQFTVTIPDVYLPRIQAAFGLGGTATQQRAVMEAWVKAQIKAQVQAFDAAEAARLKREQVADEVW